MSMKRIGGVSEGVCLVVIVLAGVGLGPPDASAFGLLDFPDPESVLAGEYKRWAVDDSDPSSLELSFAVDPGLAAALADGADVAALNALSSWGAIGNALSYIDAEYEPIENSRTNFMTMWANGGEWEGDVDDDGLGANVDIFARDQDFSVTDYRGKVHGFKDSGQSGTGSLAFTIINSSNSRILSVDLYLNADHVWSTDGGYFDVETVVLHELGHAIGLDHPDQAVEMGGANYDPWTFEPGLVSVGVEPMHSGYWPDGIVRALSVDEYGGMKFLYPSIGNYINMDHFVILKKNFASGTTWNEGDFDLDGDVDLDDFVVLKQHFDGTPTVPEPSTVILLILGGMGVMRRKR